MWCGNWSHHYVAALKLHTQRSHMSMAFDEKSLKETKIGTDGFFGRRCSHNNDIFIHCYRIAQGDADVFLEDVSAQRGIKTYTRDHGTLPNTLVKQCNRTARLRDYRSTLTCTTTHNLVLLSMLASAASRDIPKHGYSRQSCDQC